MLSIAYETGERRATLAWSEADTDSDWVRLLRRVCVDHTDDVVQLSPDRISLPWWALLSIRSQLREVLGGYGVTLKVDGTVAALLSQSAANEASYREARLIRPMPHEELERLLTGRGFTRALTKEQARNIGTLSKLAAGATFSVPGAGKTTEALAIFFPPLKAD